MHRKAHNQSTVTSLLHDNGHATTAASKRITDVPAPGERMQDLFGGGVLRPFAKEALARVHAVKWDRPKHR